MIMVFHSLKLDQEKNITFAPLRAQMVKLVDTPA